MEYYLVIKRTGTPTQVTTWMSLENISRKKSVSQKTTYCMTPFHEISTRDRFIETGSRSGDGQRKWRMSTNGHRAPSGINENVLNVITVMIA